MIREDKTNNNTSQKKKSARLSNEDTLYKSIDLYKKENFVLKENFVRKEKNTFKSMYEKFVDEKLRKMLGWIFCLIAALVLGAVTAIMFFQSVTIQESSMEPTIAIGDEIFMNRIVYKLTDPDRGDIIVFRTSASDDAALHVRRIVGLPGETIQISGGNIFIDGEVYRDTRDFPTIVNSGIAVNPITLADNEYFVLGDNRNNSEDSRYAVIGNVNKKYIVGKLWFTIAPSKKIGFMKG